MKQKDIALFIIIAAVSGIISFFAARAIFVSPQHRKLEAEIVTPISTDFTHPSNKYFNANSINPTQQIQIGNSENTAPFQGAPL
jgi:hypothetical protein